MELDDTDDGDDNAPLFYQPGKRGFYTPRPGKNTEARLNCFRNIGRYVINLSEKIVKDEYSKYQGRVPLMQAAETLFIPYLLCILFRVLNSGEFAHLEISVLVTIHLFWQSEGFILQKIVSTIFFCG